MKRTLIAAALAIGFSLSAGAQARRRSTPNRPTTS
jgi:hypothetical protein